MGIKGLLPFLSDVTENCHVSKFRGSTVAVDSYCWLHKGVLSCVEQLTRGEDTDMYVNYCLKYIKLLQSYNIHVIMVFDGRNLPAKAETETKRREQRAKCKKRGAELLSLGKTYEARNYMKQAIDVTPKMAHKLIVECRKLKVDCIVAPYESDAQLAFFSIRNIADYIITEDSDLLLFGCKQVFFKMDLAGNGQLVKIENINRCMNIRPDLYSFDKFCFMCILSGCDYLSSLSGIGIKKALKFLKMTAETEPLKFLDKLPRYLKMTTLNMTEEYKENFMMAYATFKHQTVFDPFEKKLVPLTDPAEYGTNPIYCKNVGPMYDHNTAYQIALGNVHPSKNEQFGDWIPTQTLLPSKSIWSKSGSMVVTEVKEEKKTIQFENKSYKSSKAIVSDDTPLIERNDEEADLIEIYRKLNEEEKVIEVKEVEEKPPSPVIKKNPFLKKKLSKFVTRTVTTESITQSRYFAKKETVDLNKIEIIESRTTDTDTEILKDATNLDEVDSNSKKRSNSTDSNETAANEAKRKRVELTKTLKQNTIQHFFTRMKKN